MSDKVFSDILAELKALNQKMVKLALIDEIKNNLEKGNSLFQQIAVAHQESKESLEEMAVYLRDYQSVVDVAAKDGTKRHEALLRELKSQFTRLSVLFNPELAGLTRLNNQPISSTENPVHTNSRSYLQYLADQTRLGDMTTSRTYYRVGYRSGLAAGVTGGVDEGFSADLGGAGSTMNVVSTSVNDTAAGTGVRMVNVVGINSSNVRDSENVILSGTTLVSTVKSYKYIDSFNATAVGTYGGGAVGTISLSTGGTTYAQIAVGQTLWRGAKFFTDKNQLAFIHQLSVSSYKVAVSFQLDCTPSTDIDVLIPRAMMAVNDTATSVTFPAPIIVQQNGRILVQCTPNGPGSMAYTQYNLHVQLLA